MQEQKKKLEKAERERKNAKKSNAAKDGAKKSAAGFKKGKASTAAAPSGLGVQQVCEKEDFINFGILSGKRRFYFLTRCGFGAINKVRMMRAFHISSHAMCHHEGRNGLKK
jgi:hypothetical protein